MKQVIYGILIFLFVATTAYAQESKQPLVLTIKSDKQVYEVGEDIGINVEIRNIGSDRLLMEEAPFSTFGQDSGLAFDIQTPSLARPSYIHPAQTKDIGVLQRLVYLEPNQSFKSVIILNKWYRMDQLGRNRIKAHFILNRIGPIKYPQGIDKCYCLILNNCPKDFNLSKCGEGVLWSNDITIEVVDKGKTAGKKH